MKSLAMGNVPEYWQTGPVDGIPALLQPVAHTLLQVRREVTDLLPDIPPGLLWTRSAGLASPGFHLMHMSGVLDRLFTYASGSMLNEEQLRQLAAEEKEAGLTAAELVERLSSRIEQALQQLADTHPDHLTAVRYAGRKKIPTTLIGLLFHAAEHLMRHTGQLMVTIRLLSDPGQ